MGWRYLNLTLALLSLAGSEPNELRSGIDILSDDPDYSPSEETSEYEEEAGPPKKPRLSADVGADSDINMPGTYVPDQEVPGPSGLGTKVSGPSQMRLGSSVEDVHLVSEVESEPFDVVWSDVEGRNKVFTFELKPTIDPQLAVDMANSDPVSFFRLFIDDEILDKMVEETNRYADQIIVCGIVENSISISSILNNWHPTNRTEVLKFLGLLGYMGLVRYPSTKLYWSTRYIYKNEVCPNAMSRNRFELLLSMWHFSDNEKCIGDDRVHKIRPLVEKLQQKCNSLCTPGEVVCVDESMIPFRGRLIIKQYLPNKAHKYGVKIFKLCCNKGYTWNLKIYEGKERERGVSVPTNIVMGLAEKLLDEGRTIVTDNYYTSVELARKLLNRKTHLLGTIRKNRRNLPVEVVSAKLKKGDIIARESEEGITILNWKDKRNVFILSTKHGDEKVPVKTRRGIVTKPNAVVDYNDGKGHIDISDQMSSYNTSLRKSLYWYKKVALELIFGTSLVNSHILYKLATKKNISITEFKEKVVESFLSDEPALEGPTTSQLTPTRRLSRHLLRRREGPNRKVRKGCNGCKIKKIRGIITKNNIKKVSTYCSECPGEPFYCVQCFNDAH